MIAATEGLRSVEQLLSLRDPFKRMLKPDDENRLLKKISGLETFQAEQFKVVGIISGPNSPKAILLAPDGKTHVASVSARIGMRKGRVQKINEDTIVISERIANVLGVEETKTMVLRINPDPSEGEFR
jgi:type IV pilus assembly protein PilP